MSYMGNIHFIYQIVVHFKQYKTFNKNQNMYIDSPNFPRRKVFNSNNNQSYSPNKRWDQGIHGSDRQKLSQHVANTLKQHQKDSEILQRFRRQAQNFKKQHMIQKFPSLQGKKHYRQKTPPSLNHIIVPRQNRKRLDQYSKRANESTTNSYQKKLQDDLLTINKLLPLKSYQERENMSKFNDQYQKPYQKIIIKEVPVQSGFDMNMRMDYQRIIQRKNKQIQMKDQKLKKRKHQIQRLQRKLMAMQTTQQLEKMVKQQDQLKSIKNMLSQLRQKVVQNGVSFKKSLLQRTNERRNLSELQLSRKAGFDFLNPQFNSSQQLMTQSKLIDTQQNASIVYSPGSKKNSSFAGLKNKEELQKNLYEMKKYNKRLELLKGGLNDNI